jgi:hypothetical protein
VRIQNMAGKGEDTNHPQGKEKYRPSAGKGEDPNHFREWRVQTIGRKRR